jgi:ADP-ribose pyrophosphatase YjhB (NUDIX family)
MTRIKRDTPVTKRWARIGSRDPSWLRHVPSAGLCLSSFVIVRNKNSILLGLPHANDSWPEKGGFPTRHAAELEKDRLWLLPATHLLMEESPDHAARRIANEWAGVKGTPTFLMVQSHLRPSKVRKSQRNSPTGPNHWDICFVYELETRARPNSKPRWSQTQFFSRTKIRKLRLGRGHKDILSVAGYL